MHRSFLKCFLFSLALACGTVEAPQTGATQRHSLEDGECRSCDPNESCTKLKNGTCSCECLAASCARCPRYEEE